MSTVKAGRYEIEISRQDKVLFPGQGITKGELVDYYQKIAPTMLAYLEERPLAMHRFPDGIEGENFFQKEAPDYFPEYVMRARVRLKEGGSEEMAVANNAATLVYLADQACITPHVWLSRIDRLDYPDRMIFDLDPPDDDFETVRYAARILRDIIEEVNLSPFLMTTGSRGLHVVVPLDRQWRFDDVREFALRLAGLAESRHPHRLTGEARKSERQKRLFIDCQRNAYAQTAVCPYAVRAKDNAPVATPLDWDELDDSELSGGRYDIKNIFRRLSQKEDPWKEMSRHSRSLDKPAERLEQLVKSQNDEQRGE